LHASKLPGSHNFKLCLCSSDIQANSEKLAKTPNLFNVSSEYHEFANVSKLKLKLSLLIILMTLKSIWKRVLNLWLALYTLFQHLNKRLSRNSLRKISTRVLSDQSCYNSETLGLVWEKNLI